VTNPPTNSPPAGEFALIDWIRSRTPTGPNTLLGIGDDCAIIRTTPGNDWLVTTDMLMDGRHFVLDRDGPEAAGRKALAVNLSDIAAMAGTPVAATVSVALPKTHARTIAQGIHEGLSPLARRFNVDLVGGDTNGWDGPLVISVTLFGTCPPQGAVTRAGARPGDQIFVTGPLGGSLLGRHLHPEPRILEAKALIESVPIRAMIDVSDGLVSDLGHILEESGGLGAALDLSHIPIHEDARLMSQADQRSPLDHALNDGEDFELCFVVGPEEAMRLKAGLHPLVLHHVGEVRSEAGIRIRLADGSVRSIVGRGFDHLRP